jgi:hypothetical protein
MLLLLLLLLLFASKPTSNLHYTSQALFAPSKAHAGTSILLATPCCNAPYQMRLAVQPVCATKGTVGATVLWTLQES